MIEGVAPTHPVPVRLEAFSVHAPGGFETPALTFDLARGERLGLAGESGCGKTTVLDRLAGLVRPASYSVSGQCRVAGKVGYVPQDPAASLSPFLSAIRQVTHIAGCEQTAREWLERVGLDSRRTQQARPHQLSGGQRQRVLIAMALCGRPDVLLADEPVAHLDRETQDSVLALLDREAAAAGAALVVASHQEDVFTRLGCRVERMTPAPAPLTISVPAPMPDGASTPAVRIVELTKTYRQRGFLLNTRNPHRALDGVTLEIHRGETIVLSGASGGGKSTLARCLAAREQPDSGSIVLAAGRRAQLVDQEPSGCLNPRVTVAEAIAEATSEPCGELLAEMNLPAAWETRRISTLSEGQRARVALARALAAAGGGLLILDETLGSLDDATAGVILQAVARRQRRDGLACLLITHDPRFQHVHRRLTMSNGRLVA